MPYEFKNIRTNTGDDLAKELTTLSAEGWEYLSYTRNFTISRSAYGADITTYSALLRRPVISAPYR